MDPVIELDIDVPCYRKALVEMGFGRGRGDEPWCIYIQTDGHTYIHTDRQTDKQTGTPCIGVAKETLNREKLKWMLSGSS